MGQKVDEASLDTVFRKARTHNKWRPEPVSDETLRALYDLLKFGPTATNSCPGRFVFVRSPEAKAKLKPALDAGNVDKTMAAPVTVIVAHDLEFYEKLPKLFAHNQAARGWFAGNDELIQRTAFRNGTLQGAYLIMAARSLGLDCGPMSGFNNAMVDAAFFAGTSWRSNFICSLGYGDSSVLFPRAARLGFDEACQLV
jgi:3-hydroxypropanoate dehydrogenase